MTMTRHVYSPHIDVASLKWWNTLDADTKKLLAKAMHDAALFQRADNRAKDSDRLKLLKEKGMEIEFSPDVNAFRAKVADLKNMELFKESRVNALLVKMLEATK